MSQDKQYIYATACLNSTHELITKMVEQEKKVSLSTIKKHCQGVSDWAQQVGYETDKRRGLTLEQESHVGYYKSVYDSKPCYFIRHSAVEYIWVKYTC